MNSESQDVMGAVLVSNVATRVIVGRKTKYVVLVFWVIAFALLGSLAGKLTGVEKNDAQSWLPGKAESTKVLAAQKAFQSPNTFQAVVVYERPTGLTPDDHFKAVQDIGKFAALGKIDGKIIGPVFSKAGKAAHATVPLDLGHDGWSRAGNVVPTMPTIARTRPGLPAQVTGPAGYASDSAQAFKGIAGALLFAALGVVIIALLVTYRSPILWLLPVLSAGVALAVGQGLIYLLAKNGLTVNAQSAGILTVLVFGAGTDYALLLIARYREELRRHDDRHEVMCGGGTALGVWSRESGWWCARAKGGREYGTVRRRVAGAMPRQGGSRRGAPGTTPCWTNKASFRGHPDSVAGETVSAAHFAAGSGRPVVVVSDASSAPGVRLAFAGVNGIVDVTPPDVRNNVAYIQGTMTAAPDSKAGYDP